MFRPLSPGSAVAIVAPSGPLDAELYRAGREILCRRYRVAREIDPHGPRHPRLPYLADTDEARAAVMNAALADPETEAILCARGGYGAMRILDRLDDDALQRRRLPIVGLSDVTALHLWAAGLGVPTVHGPVLTQLAVLPPGDIQALFDLLEGTPPALDGLDGLCPGRARGRLLGGNLSLLAHLAGTPFLPELEGCLLLLEEVNEAPYRIDRLLTQLELAGVLDRIAGVLVGNLLGCDSPQGVPPEPLAALEVIAERLEPLGVPVVAGAPVGHGTRNLALPLGVVADLDADAGTLRFVA